jgi:hypothetical protein
MTRTLLLLSLSLLATTASGADSAPPAGVDLAALEGWDIVVAEDAPASVLYASEELGSLLQQAAGIELPVVTETGRPEHHFFVGPSSALAASNVAFSTEGFGPEDLRIVIRDGNIALAGGQPRGTLYAVYQFLEDQVGVRFLTVDHTHVPPVGGWRVVGPLDRFYHPPLAMRWSYYGEINRNPAFAARKRVNTVTHDSKLGGTTGIVNINHSFYRQIPSQKYGKEHPEYYALVNGKRLSEVANDGYGTEPCLTHPDVLRIVTESVLEEIRAHPQRENISVSQNDNDKYCRCEDCAAIDQREGTPMGSLLTFVNAVAEAVAREHQEVKVGTLSYWYSRKPPKTIRPRPNVQIQLCSIECCLIHPINDPNCPKNVAFCRDLEDWGKICSNISIWNYNTNFTNYLLPCPNFRVLEPNVRFFVANEAKGVFMQAAGNALSAELSELRNYMISGLIWDPDRSGQDLMDEFITLHYGRAAPFVRRYVDLICDSAEASGLHRHCFARHASEYGLDESVAPRALTLFEKALAVAEDETVRKRVEKASIGAVRLALEPVWYASDPAKVSPEVLKTLEPLIRRFLGLCATYGVDRSAEHEAFGAARERLEKLLAPKEETP